jgi:diguanylate cyclase
MSIPERWPARMLARMRELSAQHDAVAPQMALDNVRRIRFAAVVVVLINLLHVAFFGEAPEATSRVARWQSGIVTIHLFMAGFALAMGVMAHIAMQRPEAGWPTLLLPRLGVAGVLAFACAITVVDQLVTASIMPLALGGIGVAMVIFIRPLEAVMWYAGLAVCAMLLLSLTQEQPQILLSNQVNVITLCSLAALLAVLTWRRNSDNLLLQRELLEQQHELQEMARVDSLTALCNRREFERLVQQELRRARRSGEQLALVLLDLDRFKQINDRYGHPVGDSVLVHTAAQLRDGVRATDVVARMGGEEFALLLPATSLDAAMALADKLRQQLEQAEVPVIDGVLRCTASFGVVSSADDRLEDFSRLYAAADAALYQAKDAGRNRVCAAAPVAAGVAA